MDNTPKQPARPSAQQALKGNIYILIATIFFGVNIPVVKALVPEWLTANDVTVFRLMGGCVLFWLASLFLKPDKIDRGDMTRIVLGGGLGLFAFIYLFNLSLRYASPINVSIIMTLPPVLVILINTIFRGARPHLLELAGVIIGLAGAVLVIVTSHSGAHSQNALIGNLLALASALCYALYLIILEKPTHKYRPVSMLRWVFLGAAVPTIALLFAFPDAPMLHTAAGWGPWLMIAFIVLCPTFLAYFLINPAEKLIGSELVSIYQYLVPVIASVTSVIMGIDGIHTVQIVAMVIIIAGMLLTNLSKRHDK